MPTSNLDRTCPPATDISAGRALLNRAREAAGGAAIDAIRDYTITGRRILFMDQGPVAVRFENTWNVAGRILLRSIAPASELLIGYDGCTVWTKTPQGYQEAPERKGELDQIFARDIWRILQNLDREPGTFETLPAAEVENKKTDVAWVQDTARNLDVILYFDAATGLLVKRTYRGTALGSVGEVEEFFSDYQSVDGVRFPFRSTLFVDGRQRLETVATAVKLNPGVALNVYSGPE